MSFNRFSTATPCRVAMRTLSRGGTWSRAGTRVDDAYARSRLLWSSVRRRPALDCCLWQQSGHPNAGADRSAATADAVQRLANCQPGPAGDAGRSECRGIQSRHHLHVRGGLRCGVHDQGANQRRHRGREQRSDRRQTRRAAGIEGLFLARPGAGARRHRHVQRSVQVHDRSPRSAWRRPRQSARSATRKPPRGRRCG